MQKTKYIKLLSPTKFMSTCVYIVVMFSILLALAYFYVKNQGVFMGLQNNPLHFAVAIMLCGFIATAVYWCIGIVINALVVVLRKRDTGIGGVLKLSNSETTMISIVVCLALGMLFCKLTSEKTDLYLLYPMLWSLPLSKLSFVNSKPIELIHDCKELLVESSEVLFYSILFATSMFIELYAGSIANLIFWAVCSTLLVSAFFIRIPVRKKEKSE